MKLCLLASVLTLAACGCKQSQASLAAALDGGGPRVTMEEMNPEAAPGEKGVLVLGGLNAPVSIVQTIKANEMTLDLRSHGESLETETYAVSSDSFSLRQAGGESFDPPLPLLKFPMNVGASWTWKGNMWSGLARSAQATVLTKADRVYGPAGRQDDAILSEVRLTMDSGTRSPAERRLAFWFVKNMGVVKREIGSGSTRLPVDGK